MIMHIHTRIDVLLDYLDDPKEKRRTAAMFSKTVPELRKILLEMKAEGIEVVMGAGCDNYDPKTGCNGHPSKKEGEIKL